MRRKYRNIKLFIYTVLFGLLCLFVLSRIMGIDTSTDIVTPLAGELPSKKPFTIPWFNKPSPTPKGLTELVPEIKKITDQQKGTYSVYIYDINTNKSYGFNETRIYTAASVIKVPILAALYYDAQKGDVDLDDQITVQARDIQDYGTGIIRNQGAGNTYSLRSLAQLMIEKSDNTAAYVLNTKLGESHIQSLVEKWGMTQTDIKNNKTSNKDIAQLMIKMYKNQIANTALTTEMIGFMDDSDFENRLPELLPDETTVYHKIGSEVGVIHDVGIVELKDKPYYIGVMTSDIVDIAATESTIAQVSKLVFDYISGM